MDNTRYTVRLIVDPKNMHIWPLKNTTTPDEGQKPS